MNNRKISRILTTTAKQQVFAFFSSSAFSSLLRWLLFCVCACVCLFTSIELMSVSLFLAFRYLYVIIKCLLHSYNDNNKLHLKIYRQISKIEFKWNFIHFKFIRYYFLCSYLYIWNTFFVNINTHGKNSQNFVKICFYTKWYEQVMELSFNVQNLQTLAHYTQWNIIWMQHMIINR